MRVPGGSAAHRINKHGMDVKMGPCLSSRSVCGANVSVPPILVLGKEVLVAADGGVASAPAGRDSGITSTTRTLLRPLSSPAGDVCL